MQLQDLFDAPQLRIRSLYVAPGALAQTVKWTFTTDLLDSRRYLARGQLVMTGLMWRRSAEDSEVFVAAVAESGAVALLAGEGLYGFVPDDVVQACRAHGLSLFAVPADVSFASITTHISNALAGDRVARLTASLVRQRELLTDVYRGQLLDDLIDRAASDLGRPIWVVTATGRLVVEPIEPISVEDIDGITSAALQGSHTSATVTAADGETLSVFLVAGTDEHRATAWFLVLTGDWNEWPPSLLESVRELAAVVGLYRVQRRGEVLARTTMTDRLLHLIATDGTQPEIGVHLRENGVEPPAELVVVAASFEGRPELHPLAMSILADAVAQVTRPLVGRTREGHAVAIFPSRAGTGTAPDAVSPVTRAIHRAGRGLRDEVLRVGISPSVTQIGLGGALRSALHGMLLPLRGARGPVQVSGPDDVTSAVHLLFAAPDHLRAGFVDLVLGPLLEHDAEHSSALVPTLRAFLDSGGSWVRTAETTHLHLNTVRYRIGRVEELTGRDLTRTADRADLYLALRLA